MPNQSNRTTTGTGRSSSGKKRRPAVNRNYQSSGAGSGSSSSRTRSAGTGRSTGSRSTTNKTTTRRQAPSNYHLDPDEYYSRGSNRQRSGYTSKRKNVSNKSIKYAAILTAFIMLVVLIGVIVKGAKKDSGTDTVSDNSTIVETKENIDESSVVSSHDGEQGVRSTQLVETSSRSSKDKDENVVFSFGRAENTDFLADALFVGDDRTSGLLKSGYLNAPNFFGCTNITNEQLAYQTIDMKEAGKHSLNEVLTTHNYKYIYIMTSVKCIRGGVEKAIQDMKAIIEMIHVCSPDAIIILQTTVNYTRWFEQQEGIIGTNGKVRDYNSQLASLVDGEKVFLFDIDTMFEKDFALSTSASRDGYSLIDSAYQTWAEYILNNVYREGVGGSTTPQLSINTAFTEDKEWPDEEEEAATEDVPASTDETAETEEWTDDGEDWEEETYDEYDEEYTEEYDDWEE